MKRKLAAPVILTIGAALSGCASQTPEPEVVINYNPPNIEVPPLPSASGSVTVSDPPPKLPKAPLGTPGAFSQEDGHCFWQPADKDYPCDPGDLCNPPPPPEAYEVECPPLPTAPQGVSVQTRPDGSCFYYLSRGSVHCPPGISCNPPPAEIIDVQCAKGPAPSP